MSPLLFNNNRSIASARTMKAKLVELVDQLHTEPSFLQRRITGVNLFGLWKKKRLIVKMKRNQIVGFAALWDTKDPHWFEIGTIWVHPEARGRGLSQKLLVEAYQARPKGTATFLVTINPTIMAHALKSGWQLETGRKELKRSPGFVHQPWTSVPFWKRIVAPWDRYPIVDKRSSLHVPGELMYRF